jgi:hypothetical protein
LKYPISAAHFIWYVPTDPSEAKDANADKSYSNAEPPSLKELRTTAPVEIQEVQQLKKSGRRSNAW